LQELVGQVAASREKDPHGYLKKNAAKRLAAVLRLAFDEIPADPTLEVYRQGDTLGAEYKHWFRAKFFQQYRLFFRYHRKARLVVLAWVNDEGTLRACESRTDAYRTFRKMLKAGKPPDDWDTLLAEAQAEADTLSDSMAAATRVMPPEKASEPVGVTNYRSAL
jgi:toxin YhaV